ncbi:MAG: heme exporter protein A [Candidatus Tokpelaia sp. JSC161]|jgi:heme exporter protein A|nr:MAG: heme exporter protein A [Candidatus Tokpelaia sp. JSC161]
MELIGTNLTVVRGRKILFSDLSFSISSRNLLIVSGPNGSGKSTLLRVIAGLHQPLAGEVSKRGWTISLFSHYLNDKNAMKSNISVGKNLQFWADWTGSVCPPLEVLKSVGLSCTLDVPFGLLSTGQKRRVALARLLLVYRPLWILDEPICALDHEASSLFKSLMRHHLDSGGMIVAASHVSFEIGTPFMIRLPQGEKHEKILYP